MIKTSKDQFTEETTYEIIGDFETREDCGVQEYTVNGLIELLKVVQKAGLGDKAVAIGFDTNICYTTIYPSFKITDKSILFDGSA